MREVEGATIIMTTAKAYMFKSSHIRTINCMPCSPVSSMLHGQAGGIKEPTHLSQWVGHGGPTDVVWPCLTGWCCT